MYVAVGDIAAVELFAACAQVPIGVEVPGQDTVEGCEEPKDAYVEFALGDEKWFFYVFLYNVGSFHPCCRSYRLPDLVTNLFKHITYYYPTSAVRIFPRFHNPYIPARSNIFFKFILEF